MAQVVTNHNQRRAIVGITLPMDKPSGVGFNTSFSTTEQYAYNLMHLILTEPYEKIFDPNFGVPKKKWLFTNFTNAAEDIDDIITDDIKVAVKRYLPEIGIVNVTSHIDVDEHIVKLEVFYTISNNPKEYSLSVNLQL